MGPRRGAIGARVEAADMTAEAAKVNAPLAMARARAGAWATKELKAPSPSIQRIRGEIYTRRSRQDLPAGASVGAREWRKTKAVRAERPLHRRCHETRPRTFRDAAPLSTARQRGRLRTGRRGVIVVVIWIGLPAIVTAIALLFC
jgi:hypothetical protein